MAQGTVELETKSLVLRRFGMDDASEMFDHWANDEEVTRYLTWKPHGSVEITKEILQAWIEQYDNEYFYNWAIVEKETGDLIGNISASKYDPKIRSVCIGYCEGVKWWHKGYMSEALRAVISYLVHEEGMLRIYAQHDVDNPNSGKAMAKAGMVKEGVLRKAGFNNKGIIDLATYSILAEEVDY